MNTAIAPFLALLICCGLAGCDSGEDASLDQPNSDQSADQEQTEESEPDPDASSYSKQDQLARAINRPLDKAHVSADAAAAASSDQMKQLDEEQAPEEE